MIILKDFKRIFARNCLGKIEFYFQNNSVINNLKCPKSKSLSHCLSEIYQNKRWTIRRWGDRSVDSSSHCIILKIVEFMVVLHVAINVYFSIQIFLTPSFNQCVERFYMVYKIQFTLYFLSNKYTQSYTSLSLSKISPAKLQRLLNH